MSEGVSVGVLGVGRWRAGPHSCIRVYIATQNVTPWVIHVPLGYKMHHSKYLPPTANFTPV